MQPPARVRQEALDRAVLRLVLLAWIDDRAEIAVAGEAHVVELDLVEAGLRCGRGDTDVVAPGAPVIRIEPREARGIVPRRSVRPLQRQVGPGGAQRWIGERDDAADEVDTGSVSRPNGRLRIVERSCGARLAGEARQGGRGERDGAVLVLDVELERVE